MVNNFRLGCKGETYDDSEIVAPREGIRFVVSLENTLRHYKKPLHHGLYCCAQIFEANPHPWNPCASVVNNFRLGCKGETYDDSEIVAPREGIVALNRCATLTENVVKMLGGPSRTRTYNLPVMSRER